jgi:hypothetical protein
MKRVYAVAKAGISEYSVSWLFVHHSRGPIYVKDVQSEEQIDPKQLLDFLCNGFDEISDVAKIKDVPGNNDVVSAKINCGKTQRSFFR